MEASRVWDDTALAPPPPLPSVNLRCLRSSVFVLVSPRGEGAGGEDSRLLADAQDVGRIAAREQLDAILPHQRHVLQAHAAPTGEIDARLDGDDALRRDPLDLRQRGLALWIVAAR